MNVINRTANAVGRTADLTIAATGAVGGGVVGGTLGAVTGLFQGAGAGLRGGAGMGIKSVDAIRRRTPGPDTATGNTPTTSVAEAGTFAAATSTSPSSPTTSPPRTE
ncbi:hypothetical protein MPY17_34110 [Rhodococcus opacus]|uniref:hypothetical protein n=1 Tax=Rhodococcus opacus TaxID=37919 RepID=UPI001FF19B37|nr:hypothetical protein [Rhodococcus opacus]UOT03873.1 hypothetical protein MPY17_34110 [Rhodococcus opacus]